MKFPEIFFTSWYKWSERKNIENAEKHGVYILAKFSDIPLGNANPLDEKVIYVGETCNNSLKGRWNQFNRSAFHSKYGHSGGSNYNIQFNDNGNDLYVSAFPILDLSEKIAPFFIRYVERKMILDYAIKNGNSPELNKN